MPDKTGKWGGEVTETSGSEGWGFFKRNTSMSLFPGNYGSKGGGKGVKCSPPPENYRKWSGENGLADHHQGSYVKNDEVGGSAPTSP